MDQGFDVYCGLDVGKSEHHATALSRAGERLFDKPLPQDEARLRELFTTLQQHGNVLMVVDQPNTIGALPVAVARDCGCEVAYLPGLAMRKAADLHPGNSKTDARDAFIIAETARAMPHTLRAVDRDSEVRSPRPTTTGNAPRERSTTPPSSASPGAAATSSTRCSETGHSTRKKLPRPLDQKHRDTPLRCRGDAAKGTALSADPRHSRGWRRGGSLVQVPLALRGTRGSPALVL
ncbi:hypothetical protein NicSoilB8_45360 (plasmid) [Arthrobacter sp. NicSoilB8]|nr:hypothetical protein NicSoilB8_45360 [Arthrobacter sp. NicSoilB8]